MMKKIATLVAAGALLAAAVVPAFGAFFERNVANVGNNVTAISNTGVSAGNAALIEKAGVYGEVEVGGNNTVQKLHTGDADALAVGVVVANTHVGCSSCDTFASEDVANVGNGVGAQAGTGIGIGNAASVKKAHVSEVEVGGNNTVQQLHTGDANTNAWGVVLVNTHWNW